MSAFDPKPTLQNGKQLPRIASPAASCDRWRIITSVRRSRGRTERFAEIAAEFVNRPYEQPEHLMNNENTCREDRAALSRVLSRLELQKQVTDFAAQRLAISEVMRAIIRSPHDLQPILQTIVDSAVQLCRAEGASFVL
jgi:hypothetical protein